jgi:uncharacterized protein (DUF952 family)
MDFIYHLALAKDWEQAKTSPNQEYVVSALGATLEVEGFIHCSFAEQVPRIADFIYKGIPNVILLQIDQVKLKHPVKFENLDGGTDLFPHIYGPLNIDAVINVEPYET